MPAYLIVDTAIENAGDLDRAAFGFRFRTRYPKGIKAPDRPSR